MLLTSFMCTSNAMDKEQGRLESSHLLGDQNNLNTRLNKPDNPHDPEAWQQRLGQQCTDLDKEARELQQELDNKPSRVCLINWQGIMEGACWASVTCPYPLLLAMLPEIFK